MVTKVWGKADSFELAFSPFGIDQWSAVVPAALDDGQYVVELYCQDDVGNTAYWTGILYLNKSENVSVRIVADKFKLWLDNDIGIAMAGDLKVWMQEDIRLNISFSEYIGRG